MFRVSRPTRSVLRSDRRPHARQQGSRRPVAAGTHQPVLQDIQAGATDGDYTEVLSGLVEGDWIARPRFALQKQNNNNFNFMSPPPTPIAATSPS